MDSARWERIQELFHAVLELDPAERLRHLESQGVDRELIAVVMGMVEADQTGSVLDRDVAGVASEVLGLDPTGGANARFGAYRLERILGEGGMGVVYLAIRDDIGARAAIKILRDAWLSPARRERFAAEQRTLALLDHPAIARLLDADALPDGTPWFVMEYVEGLPLLEYCRTHDASITRRLRLFRAVAEAVQHAHVHAVIHRDLKPSNILVKPDGSIKLLDFGIAKQIESLDLPVDQTQTGLRMMTPAYASPEQIRGSPVGVRSDVYSLGVILYELLVDRLPFDVAQLTPIEVAEAVVNQDPPRPSVLAPAVAARTGGNRSIKTLGKSAWADLDVLCLTAMHRDPARRYGTVEALIRDLDHFLAGEPLDARPDSVGYRVGKFVRRNKGPVIASGLAIALVVAVVAVSTFRLARARTAALAEAARAGRMLGFTLDLFEGGDKEVGPADSLRVVTLLERGLQSARTLDRDPAAKAELESTLGGIYQKLGNFTRADSLLTVALDERRRLFPTGSAELIESLTALARLRIDQAKFEDAERLVRTALHESVGVLPETHPARLKATVALGRVLQERGKYPEAITADAEVVRLTGIADGESSPEFATSLGQLADAHFYAGQYPQSDSLNQRALAIYRRLYGEKHPSVASILINLGATEIQRGNYSSAERYHRLALAINRAFYGEDHFQTASNLNMLGQTLIFEKKMDEGFAAIEHALAIRERVFGPNHPMVASTLNELGNSEYVADRYDSAEVHFKRALEIYTAAYGPADYKVGVALSNLASVYLARKQYREAETLYRRVVAIHTAALSADHVNTAIVRIKLGRSLLRQGRLREAVVETTAGYRILSKDANPNISYLRAARRDLIIAYDSLGQPDSSARFRAEMAALEPKSDSTKRK